MNDYQYKYLKYKFKYESLIEDIDGGKIKLGNPIKFVKNKMDEKSHLDAILKLIKNDYHNSPYYLKNYDVYNFFMNHFDVKYQENTLEHRYGTRIESLTGKVKGWTMLIHATNFKVGDNIKPRYIYLGEIMETLQQSKNNYSNVRKDDLPCKQETMIIIKELTDYMKKIFENMDILKGKNKIMTSLLIQFMLMGRINMNEFNTSLFLGSKFDENKKLKKSSMLAPFFQPVKKNNGIQNKPRKIGDNFLKKKHVNILKSREFLKLYLTHAWITPHNIEREKYGLDYYYEEKWVAPNVSEKDIDDFIDILFYLRDKKHTQNIKKYVPENISKSDCYNYEKHIADLAKRLGLKKKK